MINLVNQIIEEYGKPDEVRIELARLKQSAEDREKTTKEIAASTRKTKILKILFATILAYQVPLKQTCTGIDCGRNCIVEAAKQFSRAVYS